MVLSLALLVYWPGAKEGQAGVVGTNDSTIGGNGPSCLLRAGLTVPPAARPPPLSSLVLFYLHNHLHVLSLLCSLFIPLFFFYNQSSDFFCFSL